MADAYTIQLGDSRGQLVPDGDTGWLDGMLAGKPGSTAVRIRAAGEEEDDTEGHAASLRMRVIVETDDTEGHAVSIHFPTRGEADAVRRRLVLGGVLAGSVALGAATGLGLSALGSGDAPSFAAGAAATQAGPASDVGIMDASGAAIAGSAAVAQPAGSNADAGIMDASGAAIAGAATVAQAADANADVGIMDASGAAAPESAPDEPAEKVVGPR